MAFKEVVSLEADVTVALGKTDKKTGKPYPKEAEGYYLGSRSVENKRGESKIHFLQTAKGNLGLWGTTDLNRKLAQVISGTMVRVTSTGTRPTPNGDMYTYKVAVDSENTIDVGTLSAAPADEADYSDDLSSDDSSETSEADSDEAAAMAVRKAKVEALLRSKRK